MIERLRDLTENLRRQREDPASGLHFEAQLAREDLLGVLEETGALPKVHDPNPYDLTAQRQEYDQWWHDNPTECQAFRQCVKDRQQVLRHLQTGSMLLGRRQEK